MFLSMAQILKYKKKYWQLFNLALSQGHIRCYCKTIYVKYVIWLSFETVSGHMHFCYLIWQFYVSAISANLNCQWILPVLMLQYLLLLLGNLWHCSILCPIHSILHVYMSTNPLCFYLCLFVCLMYPRYAFTISSY